MRSLAEQTRAESNGNVGSDVKDLRANSDNSRVSAAAKLN